MKEEILRRAITGIDDKLIEEADTALKTVRKSISRIKIGAAAAAFILVFAMGAMLLPGMIKGGTPATPDTTGTGENDSAGIGDPNYHGSETYLYEAYDYSVDEGRFSSYVKGRVITADKVGEKLADVTVTAGWVRAPQYEQAEKEHARAEIFEIKGVSADTAVAIKFLDKLEAQLTDCYYVIMNPDADLSPVQNYVIAPYSAEEYDGAE